MTRHLFKTTLLAAGAVTVLAVAPAVSAAPTLDTKPAKLSQTQYTKLAQHSDRNRRAHRSDRSRHRTRHYRSDRHRTDRYRADRHRTNRHRNHRVDRHRHDYRRNNYRHRTRHNYYRHGWNDHYRGYYTPYRSRLGISFHFGTPGYSQYRWAHSPFSFYRPSYGSYGYYTGSTHCRRVTIEGWHHGHRELISVKQCSNPWDGTYIVQGSERIISCRF